MARVRECWGSLYSTESMTYRRRHAIPEERVAMAVVVQRMVDARCAGVMFTRAPLTGDKSVITIEGAWGLGSAVVAGEVTPDRWVLGRITGEISVRDISDKHAKQVPADGGGIREVELEGEERTRPYLTDDQLLALREVGRRVERHYGKAQDIEWALDEAGDILLLQSRPRNRVGDEGQGARRPGPRRPAGGQSARPCDEHFRRPQVSLSRKDIAEIMHLLETSRFDRLYLEIEGLKLELSRGGTSTPRGAPPPPVPPAGPWTPAPPAAPSPQAPAAGRKGLSAVKSPLLDVFYHAPKPGEPPFVAVGDTVEADSVVGIIEVMKSMNSARAGVAGEVVEIVAANGEMVEHSEVLMLVRPD